MCSRRTAASDARPRRSRSRPSPRPLLTVAEPGSASNRRRPPVIWRSARRRAQQLASGRAHLIRSSRSARAEELDGNPVWDAGRRRRGASCRGIPPAGSRSPAAASSSRAISTGWTSRGTVRSRPGDRLQDRQAQAEDGGGRDRRGGESSSAVSMPSPSRRCSARMSRSTPRCSIPAPKRASRPLFPLPTSMARSCSSPRRSPRAGATSRRASRCRAIDAADALQRLRRSRFPLAPATCRARVCSAAEKLGQATKIWEAA